MAETTENSLFFKYKTQLEENPNSRVFAPLAEIYRKMGMMSEAIDVLKKGISKHPDYVFGHLGLAFCYYDLQQYSKSYEILEPVATTNRDNIRLQKLYAEICEKLGHKEKALETFKYLLFLNPKDKDIAEEVKKLEMVNEDTEQRIAFNIELDAPVPEEKAIDFDEWIEIDFSKSNHVEPETVAAEEWKLKQFLKQDNEKPSENANEPVITHTLVDLYVSQGHLIKAIDVLEKIIALNPRDDRSIQKLEDVKKLMLQEQSNKQGKASEHGASDFSQKSPSKNSGEKPASIEKAFKLFADALRKKAKSQAIDSRQNQ